jgi:hypothetical protein
LVLSLSCSLAYADAEQPGKGAKQLIESVESVAAHRQLASEPLGKAKNALERSENARRSQDAAHADMLDALALEWAETARDLTRAAELEKKVSDVQQKGADVEAKTVRAMAIVEAAVARRGRAEEKLKALDPQAVSEATPREEPARKEKPQ